MSTPISPSAPPTRSAYAEASVWLAQLYGPERSVAMESDFRSWLAASPQHAAAFEQVTEVWSALGNVSHGGLPRVAPAARSRPRHRSPGFAGAAISICALLAVIAFWLFKDPVYSTGIGEQRVMRLDDGTQVSMNSASRIEVDYNDARRMVRLEKGEVLFDVAHAPQRPFVVLAGDHAVTAVGTSFVVRRDRDRIDVTLLQGRVTVAPTTTGSPQLSMPSVSPAPVEGTISLSPGERLVVRSHVVKLDTRPAENATAWRRGEVIFDSTPLRDAVEEMNRYDRSRLAIDPEVGALTISGVYRIGNNADFARALARVYELEVDTADDQIRLRARNSVPR